MSRMNEMNTRSARILHLLKLPKYETTKLTSKEDMSLAIKGFSVAQNYTERPCATITPSLSNSSKDVTPENSVVSSVIENPSIVSNYLRKVTRKIAFGDESDNGKSSFFFHAKHIGKPCASVSPLNSPFKKVNLETSVIPSIENPPIELPPFLEVIARQDIVHDRSGNDDLPNSADPDVFNDTLQSLSPEVPLQNDLIINYHHDFAGVLHEPNPKEPASDDDDTCDSVEEPSIYLSSGSDYIPESASSGDEENLFVPAEPRVKLISQHILRHPTPKDETKLKEHQAELELKRQLSDVTASKKRLRSGKSEERAKKEENKDEVNDACTQDIEQVTAEEGEEVSVRTSKKHPKSDKRVRDKRHCCYLCSKVICNLPRHLELMHKNDTSLERILALPKGSKKRRMEFAKLQRVGDFYHNCEVLRFKRGELILLRCPTPYEKNRYTYCHYGPCPDCMGFMLKKHIGIHIKNGKCVEMKHFVKDRKPVMESNALLTGIHSPSLSSSFVNNVVSKLRDDETSKTCKNDELIMAFGNMLYQKYATSQSELIRQSMRQLGRLVQEINATKTITLAGCLEPERGFDIIVNAVNTLCAMKHSETGRPEFGTPSLGLKIGHHLKKCASIERGKALRCGDSRRSKELKDFLSLMDLEWKTRVSSNALNTLYKRKFNMAQLLPLTTDLVKLNTFIEREMTRCQKLLEKDPTSTKWQNFASLVLCRIVLFNKRRSGEASKMLLKNYAMRPLWSEQTTQELKNSLTKFEQELARKLTIVEVEGKRGRKVPVLLTPKIKNAIDLLISSRAHVGISSTNEYIFARSSSESHLRGHDCIRKFANQADLERPENVTGTKLRKYIATVCQVFDLSENETDWLANHLGHDIRVHRDFYRLHESAVEITKVSRLLLAIDGGEANEFSGKKLCDIEVKDLPQLEESENEADEERDDETTNGPSKKDESGGTKQKKKAIDIQEFSQTSSKGKRTQGKTPKKTTSRTPWSREETEAVSIYFRQSIKKASVPGKNDCEACIQKFSVLKKRKWTDIKFHVKNQIDKIKKLRK